MSEPDLNRLRDLVVAVLDLPAEERDSYLEGACGGDDTLLSSVKRLLNEEPIDADRSHALDAVGGDEAIANAAALPERVGRYEILGRLGAGGMGIVYLAVDPSLDRRVALKVLPPRLAGDAAGIARFREEARLLARLNHPNIATIHSLEAAGEVVFITMEHVHGPTLAARIGSDARDDELRIAYEIACALEAAHAKGIVHRDLKPSNVIVSSETGTVKVVDFGLAKLARERSDSPAAAAAPAVPSASIDASWSLVLGTPGYMSPEQVRGETTDEGSDIWAFGCVLYELSTGTRAFDGSAVDRMVATLARDVDLECVRGRAPDAVHDLVERCLRIDRDERLRSIAEARRILGSLLQVSASFHGDLDAPTATESLAETLPTYTTRLVGREREIDEISTLLTDRLVVTLTGFGGAGKTRLATEVARRSADRFPDGCWFVDLAPASDEDDVLQLTLSVMNLRETAGESPVDTLVSFLRTRRALVILDNCEQVVDACSALAAMVTRGCPRTRVLATSRSALFVGGGQIYAVAPLARPAADGAFDEARRSPAVTLLEDRAKLIDMSFELSESNFRAVSEICRRLDGLPLAIELASTRLDAMTPDELLESLEGRLPLQGHGPAGPDRHRSLTGLVAWSYDRLSDAEQAFLRRLSVFRGGWTLRSAEAVCSDPGSELVPAWQVLDLTRTLVQRSLIERATVVAGGLERSRYGMLETIRTYAADQLHAHGEEEAIRARHVQYFLAQPTDPGHDGTTSATWIALVSADDDNFTAALSEPYRRSISLFEATSLARQLLHYWTVTGRWRRGQRVYQSLVDAIVREGQTGTRHHAEAVAGVGRLVALRGENDLARKLLTEARRIGLEIDEEDVVSVCDTGLSYLARIERRFDEALELADRRVRHWEPRCGSADVPTPQERSVRRHLSAALLDRGQCLARFGRFDEAGADFEWAHELASSVGDVGGSALPRAALAGVKHRTGDVDAARDLYLEALAYMRTAKQRDNNLVSLLNNLALLSLETDDARSADEYACEAREVAIELGSAGQATHALYLAGLAKIFADRSMARERLRQAIEESRAATWAAGLVHALNGMLHVEVLDERFEEAWAIGLELMELLTPIDGLIAATTLGACARTRLALGSPSDAAFLLGAAEEARERSNAPFPRGNRQLIEDWSRMTRDSLDAADFERWWNEGRKAPLESLRSRWAGG